MSKVCSNSNPIPHNLNELLAKLKIISKTEQGEKINMVSMTFTKQNEWFGWFWRGRQGEGRKNMIVQLEQIINQAITAITEYQNTEFLTMIINRLVEARNGITNLITTYQADKNTSARLELIIDNINLQLKNYTHLLDGQRS